MATQKTLSPAAIAFRRSVANLLSLSRIPLGIMICIMIQRKDPAWQTIGLFAVGGLTDFLDGLIARSAGQTTRLGAVLDPACDKALVLPTLYALWPAMWAPGAITLGVLELTFFITAMLALKKSSAEDLKANRDGKRKMATECVAILAFLLGSQIDGNMMLGFAIVFALRSACAKFNQFKRGRLLI